MIPDSFRIEERIYDGREYGVALRIKESRDSELMRPERHAKAMLAVERFFQRKLGEDAVIGPARSELRRDTGSRKFPYRLYCLSRVFLNVHPDDQDIVRRFAGERRRVFVPVIPPISVNATYPTI